MAQVVVTDDDARTWQVRWHGWEDQLSVAKLETEADDVSQVFQPLGDLDDADQRLVWLRPEGVKDWCKVTGRLD